MNKCAMCVKSPKAFTQWVGLFRLPLWQLMLKVAAYKEEIRYNVVASGYWLSSTWVLYSPKKTSNVVQIDSQCESNVFPNVYVVHVLCPCGPWLWPLSSVLEIVSFNKRSTKVGSPIKADCRRCGKQVEEQEKMQEGVQVSVPDRLWLSFS